MRAAVLVVAAALAIGGAATVARAQPPGVGVTSPTEGQVLEGPTATVTVTFDASCETNGTKYVVADVYDETGKVVASSGTEFDLTRSTAIAFTPDSATVVVTGYSFGTTVHDWVTLAYDASNGAGRWARRYDGPVHGTTSPTASASALTAPSST